jgi:hypothetical protein
MSHLESLLPAGKALLSPEDLVTCGLFDNLSQVSRAVENGIPAIRTSYRTVKFCRGDLLEWLSSQRTQPKKKPSKKAINETVSAEITPEAALVVL